MFEDKRSYYAIIPADVRYDGRLCANAKLMYGEITALCNDKGYCWATNAYFANLYQVSKQSVSNWIAQLRDFGYINEIVDKDENTKQIIQRRIYINKEKER